MKKIVAFILLISAIMMLVACSGNGKPGKATPEMTPKEVYEAGKNKNALLGNHKNVYIVATSNGKVISEEFFSKEYVYTFYDEEYLDIGVDNSTFATDHSEYVFIDNVYSRYVTLGENGIVDMKEAFSLGGEIAFISSIILDDAAATVKEKNGVITVTCKADENKLEQMGYENMASCVETYTLDAKTREMTGIKTVYTYKDGKVEEGILTITRDVEIPEGMKEFVRIENEKENTRTITIVLSPGADNEKTETVKVAKGVAVAFTPDYLLEKTFTMYADASCTQVVEGDLDVNSDLTVYIKWNE
jgi:hypothetical protein